MNYKFPDAKIFIFSKPAIAGKCKTRLIPSLGNERAAKVQSKLLIKIIDDLLEYQLCPFEIWQSVASPYFTELNSNYNHKLILETQIGNDLGERMSHALSSGLKRSKMIIIIGSDCIEYSKQYLVNAIRSLDDNEMVIGPAFDGGYVLIGGRFNYPEVFKGVHWGTDKVYRESLAVLNSKNISYSQLNPLNDIDTADDYEKAVQICRTILT